LSSRFPFGIPIGWFVVATSREIRPGSLLTRRYFDRELVIYRTRSGVLSVVDAHCPHMGAHLGKVGRVEGETLRCGFHGFQYDGRGTCVSTAYDSPPPPNLALGRWPVREQNGLVLVWFDAAGRAPSFEVPLLDDAEWTRLRWKRYRIATHPQETTENSVDFGHFTQLHGFVDGQVTRPLRTEGPYLTSRYRALRPYGLPGREPLWKLIVEYDVMVWGLGYSHVRVELPQLSTHLRVWILPTPVDEENVDLIVALAVEPGFGPMPEIMRYFGHRIVCKEVDQDLDIWTYKKFVDPPRLAKGDGPVVAYRRWARQFYPNGLDGPGGAERYRP